MCINIILHLISNGPGPTLWVPVYILFKAHLDSGPVFGFVRTRIVEAANVWVLVVSHPSLRSRITRFSSKQEHIWPVEALVQPADDVKIEHAHSKCMRNPNSSIKWNQGNHLQNVVQAVKRMIGVFQWNGVYHSESWPRKEAMSITVGAQRAEGRILLVLRGALKPC